MIITGSSINELPEGGSWASEWAGGPADLVVLGPVLVVARQLPFTQQF